MKEYIAYKDTNNKYKAVYCHYATKVETLLLDHYNTYEKVKELIGSGPVYILDKNIGRKIVTKHEHYQEAERLKNKQCLFYKRDLRVKTDVLRNKVKEFNTKPELLRFSMIKRNRFFVYLYEDTKWQLYEYDGNFKNYEKDMWTHRSLKRENN